MHHRRIGRTTKGNIQRDQKPDVRQIPILQLQRKTKTATGKISSKDKKAALCNWEELEDSLVKSIFVQGIRNPLIQINLLPEDCDTIGTLQ